MVHTVNAIEAAAVFYCLTGFMKSSAHVLQIGPHPGPLGCVSTRNLQLAGGGSPHPIRVHGLYNISNGMEVNWSTDGCWS